MPEQGTAMPNTRVLGVYSDWDKERLIRELERIAERVEITREANQRLTADNRALKDKVRELEAELAQSTTFGKASAAAVLGLAQRHQPQERQGRTPSLEWDAELHRGVRMEQRTGAATHTDAVREERERREQMAGTGTDAPPPAYTHTTQPPLALPTAPPAAPPAARGSEGMELARQAQERRAEARTRLWDAKYQRDTGMW